MTYLDVLTHTSFPEQISKSTGPLFTSTGLILRNIMKTAQDSYTITIKQIVRFQERMHFEKIQLDQIQNGRQSDIIHFHMAVIW